MLDFHSHILFNFDDGPKTIEESLQMLRRSKDAGADTVISTSHCYPHSKDGVEEFLDRRERRFAEIEAVTNKDPDGYPRLIKGCEVHLTGDIAAIEDIEKLCIEDTDYMLVELPYVINNETPDLVYNLTLKGIKPVMAHIERYADCDAYALENLFSLGVLYQVNADTLAEAPRKTVYELIESGHCHVIGSDMHNLTYRPPCVEKGYNAVAKYYGEEAAELLEQNARNIIKNKPIDLYAGHNFKRVPAFKRLLRTDRRKDNDTNKR